MTQELVRDVLIGLWALAGIVLLIRRPKEPLGILLLAASALALAGSLVDALAPIALGLVPAVGLQMLLGMPDGRLSTTGRRIIAAIFYVAGAGVAAYLWTQRPEYPVWPVVTLCIAVLIAGTIGFVVRYGATSPAGQRRMRWLAWGATVAAIVAVVALGLHALVQWPADVGPVAAAATGLVPISLIAGSSARLERTIDPLLVSTISLAGLTALVVIVYVAIVLGLGRVPRESNARCWSFRCWRLASARCCTSRSTPARSRWPSASCTGSSERPTKPSGCSEPASPGRSRWTSCSCS